MRPFVLVTVDSGTVDTTVVGDSQVSPIVIDWDELETNPSGVQEILDAIDECYEPGEQRSPETTSVYSRLFAILEDAEGDEDEEEDEDFDDEDDLDFEDDDDFDFDDEDEDEEEEEEDDTSVVDEA